MKIDVFSINDFIKVNSCLPVTNRFYLASDGLPSDDGLFSTTVFGKFGSDERKNNFAYVDLRRKFFHPLVYNAIYEMFRALPMVLSGDKYARVDARGKIVLGDTPDKGECGIDFFHRNWSKIRWTEDGVENKSRAKKENLLSMLDINEIFIDKWLIIPAYYRDVNFSSASGSKKITVEGVNASYIKLLNAATSESITFANSYLTQSSVQMILNEIHAELTQKIAGKRGVIRQAIMGKSIDYSTIGVLSCPPVGGETPDQQRVPYNYFGVPLHFALALFYPFILKWLEDFFHEYEHSASIRLIGDKAFNLPDTVYETISSTSLAKLVNGYIHDKTKRIRSQRFWIEGLGEKSRLRKDVKGLKNTPDRPYTLTDLLYEAAMDVCRDKHVVATRFPVTGPESVMTCRIKLLTTERTVDLSAPTSAGGSGDKRFSDYPYFPADDKGNVLVDEIRWVDTYQPNLAYLKRIGGDFDGDTMRVVGLFSSEANREAEKIMYSPMNYVDSQANFWGGVYREGGLALYMMTKEA
jgi:hypothetical protein